MSRNLQECEFHYVSGGSAFENALNACKECILCSDIYTGEITRLSNSPCPNGICDIYPVEDLSGDHLLPACPTPTPAPSAPSTGSSSSSWWGGWKPSFPWSGWLGW